MFLHHFYPSPILLKLGIFTVYWYGFLIALALIISFLIARKLFQRYNLPVVELYDLFFYSLVTGLIGARLWHIFSEFNYYFANPIDIFKIWNGGLAIHGAVLFGLITVWIFAKKAKLNFLLLVDIFAPLLALSQAIGRWGNYFNQELYGRPVGWGIPIAFQNRLPGFQQFEFFHPIFLYESLWLLLGFAVLITLHRLRLTHNPQKGICSLFNGIIFLIYLILWSLGRFSVSFLRIDPMWSALGLRFDQWVSLAIIIVAITLFIVLRKQHKSCKV